MISPAPSARKRVATTTNVAPEKKAVPDVVKTPKLVDGPKPKDVTPGGEEKLKNERPIPLGLSSAAKVAVAPRLKNKDPNAGGGGSRQNPWQVGRMRHVTTLLSVQGLRRL